MRDRRLVPRHWKFQGLSDFPCKRASEGPDLLVDVVVDVDVVVVVVATWTSDVVVVAMWTSDVVVLNVVGSRSGTRGPRR
jgi:hypothetical protein